MNYFDQIEQAANFIRQQIGERSPSVGLVLGSGLGELGNELEQPVYMPFEQIPHFPQSTVEGHAGRLIAGTLEGKSAIVMQGRFHYYEGYSMKKIVFPVYVMQRLGISTLVLTNAAGGMNRDFQPGDLMLITDHINLTGDNPLIGPNDARIGVRFPDMSQAYHRPYLQLARNTAERIEREKGGVLRLQEGVYCGISGPAYMTPAELKMLAAVGGDAVGMSTVAEAIAARHCGMKVLGISCITDMAIGDELEALTHEQVVAVAERSKPKFKALVRGFVKAL